MLQDNNITITTQQSCSMLERNISWNSSIDTPHNVDRDSFLDNSFIAFQQGMYDIQVTIRICYYQSFFNDQYWSDQTRIENTGFLILIRTNAHVYFALDGGLVQRCVVPVVSSVGVRAATQQEADHLRVPERAGVMERDQTTVVAGMDIRSGLQEMLDHVLSPKACQSSQMTISFKCIESNMMK